MSNYAKSRRAGRTLAGGPGSIPAPEVKLEIPGPATAYYTRADAYPYHCARVTPGWTGTLTAVELWMARVTGSPGNLNVRLWAVTAGEPGTLLATSDTYLTNAWSTDPAWHLCEGLDLAVASDVELYLGWWSQFGWPTGQVKQGYKAGSATARYSTNGTTWSAHIASSTWPCRLWGI